MRPAAYCSGRAVANSRSTILSHRDVSVADHRNQHRGIDRVFAAPEDLQPLGFASGACKHSPVQVSIRRVGVQVRGIDWSRGSRATVRRRLCERTPPDSPDSPNSNEVREGGTATAATPVWPWLLLVMRVFVDAAVAHSRVPAILFIEALASFRGR